MSNDQQVQDAAEAFSKLAQDMQKDPVLKAEIFGEPTSPPKGGASNIDGGEFVNENKEFFVWRMVKTTGRKAKRAARRIKDNSFVRYFVAASVLIAIFAGIVFAVAQLYMVAPLAVHLLAAGMLAQIIASLIAYAGIKYAEHRATRKLRKVQMPIVVPNLVGNINI